MRTPLIKHKQIIRLGRILDMLYRPKEIAKEIGVIPDTVYRSYLPAGLPYFRNRQGIWIYGPAFVAWAKDIISQHRRSNPPMPKDSAWCAKCNQPVTMLDPQIKYSNYRIEIMQSICPTCGCHINRIRKAGGDQ